MKSIMKSITGISRGCGTRKVGGLYICCGLSPFGKPIEEFIIDPPVSVPYKNFRTPILIDNDILLWVGSQYYPFPSDFIEEAKAFGVSKRIPVTFPVEKITSFNKMYFVHPKAIIENFKKLPPPIYCPKDYQNHLNHEECCIGYSYSLSGNKETRKIGDIIYQVYPFKEIPDQIIYTQGIFLVLPVTHFDFVIGEEKHNNIIEKAKEISLKANIPVNLESC